MEDKTYSLLTKMYGELSKRFDGVDGRLDLIENRLNKLELVTENEIKPDIKMLCDGYQHIYEKVTVVEQKVDSLSEIVERQEVEIRVIKGGKV